MGGTPNKNKDFHPFIILVVVFSIFSVFYMLILFLSVYLVFSFQGIEAESY